MPRYQQVAIVGVGLLGGAIGMALRQRNLVGEVVGIGRNRQNLDKAAKLGAIDRPAGSLAEGVAHAELVIICTPVDVVAATAIEAARSISPAGWLTDVASTKGEIVGEIESALPAGKFVGSHPLAGDHRSGVEYARPDLFVGKQVIVTPTSTTPSELTCRAAELWRLLDATVVEMSPDEHDQALAHTSHLPHLVASALALCTPSEVRRLAARGWLDTTRVAAGDASLWRPIFASNRAEVAGAVAKFQHHLDRLVAALHDQDDEQLEQLLAEGKKNRDAVGS